MLDYLARWAKAALVLTGFAVGYVATPNSLAAQSFPLDSTKGLDPRGVKVEPVTYLGRKAIRAESLQSAEILRDLAAGRRPAAPADASAAAAPSAGGLGLIMVPGVKFQNGTIELELSGKPVAGAPPEARGFVGLAFRINTDASKYEYVYLRPTNGRAEDQERRNHTLQYASHPDYGFFRLRKESPGKYEAYADMVAGEWTKVKIEVNGVKLRLYINGATQPALVVNDLKLGDVDGGIGLSAGAGTEAHFANLRIQAAN